jgi:hypothetical protein
MLTKLRCYRKISRIFGVKFSLRDSWLVPVAEIVYVFSVELVLDLIGQQESSTAFHKSHDYSVISTERSEWRNLSK